MPGPRRDVISPTIELLRGIGYDRDIGPLGAFTIPTDNTIPHTIPGMPGIGAVLKPRGRDLTPEEKAHEGVHGFGGLPLAIAGKLGGMALGTGVRGAYLDPDEVAAYGAQPDTPETRSDLSTVQSMAKDQGGMYGRLVQRLLQGLQGR